MPITSSAKKALRASKKKRLFNLRRKAAIDRVTREFQKALAAKDKSGAANIMSSLYQAVDKAVKTGYLKPNAASRTKSRAMAALKKLS